MAFPFAAVGAALSGLGSAAGGLSGLFGGKSGGTDWNKFNQEVQNQDRYWMQNANLQREFAQNSIQWRVADAKAAGIHPLFAMGANMGGASPTAYIPGGDSAPVDRGDMGASLSNMGQGIGRAVAAMQSKEEREVDAMKVIQIENGHLQNELLKMQIASAQARLARDQIGPPMPGVNSQFGIYEPKPPEVLNRDPNAPGQTAGPTSPPNTWYQFPTGHVVSQPSKDLNIDEASSPGWLSWMLHNRVLPFVSQRHYDAAKPSKSHLPAGAYDWRLGPLGWDPVYFKGSTSGHLRKDQYDSHPYGPPQYQRNR